MSQTITNLVGHTQTFTYIQQIKTYHTQTDIGDMHTGAAGPVICLRLVGVLTFSPVGAVAASASGTGTGWAWMTLMHPGVLPS